MTQENGEYVSEKDLYTNVHRSSICNSQKTRNKPNTHHQRTGKQIVLYWYNGILLSSENKGTIATHNICEYQQNNTVWKNVKQTKKICMPYDFLYIKV